MSEKILIVIDHRPTPKQRPAWMRGRAVTPKKTRDYEAMLANVARATMISNNKKMFKSGVPIKVTATFVFEVPKSWSAVKKEQALSGELPPITTSTGDIDNLLKACLDGFNKVVFEDDKTITELSSKKKYGSKNQIIVLVEEVLHG